MKQKSKSKTSARATRNHRARRNRVEVNVKPVAIQSEDSPQALIPASVRSTPEGTDAVISVEVKRGRSTRRRAAVIPIAVRRRARSEHERQPREDHDSSTRNQERWSDPVTDSIFSAAEILKGMVRVAHDFGFAVVNAAEVMSNAIFSRMTVVASAAEQGRLDKVDIGTVVRNPRRAEMELRAA